ncbi:MAG: arginine--tRNA ligase [Capsulimonadaceae bacterium]|nr:arginine--tRNA ligase [Capsulimonadaceae bacterium]
MTKEQLINLIALAIGRAQEAGEIGQVESLPPLVIDVPKNRAHGDYASNIALILAKPLKMPPRSLAEIVVKHIQALDAASSEPSIDAIEIAGPGFINFKLQGGWLPQVIEDIVAKGEQYGRSNAGEGRKVLVEYVSANPNGPITVAHGRGGAIGDAVASLQAHAGYDVTREFYVNDALNSTQMNNFARSVFYRYQQLFDEQLAKDDPYGDADWLYGGDYIRDIAIEFRERYGAEYEGVDLHNDEAIAKLREHVMNGTIDQQKEDLAAFGIVFDSWVFESQLYESGKVREAISELVERGETYEHEGALWFRSTKYGDDKDRVLRRSNGSYTYIAGDIAYHREKFHRGFDLLVDVWGADHGGYVARTKAALSAFGTDAGRLKVLLFQLVRILKDGEMVRSSKRRGNILELKADLIDEIGKDAARFFFLMRSSDVPLDIDLDLAKEQSAKNPVFYVQYAHARTCSVFEKASQLGIAVPAAADLSLLTQQTEADLVKKLRDLPDEIAYAARQYEPHHITHYLRELAALFHTFYDAGNNDTALRVLCEDAAVRDARLVLVSAVRTVLRNALGVLGLSAPEKM